MIFLGIWTSIARKPYSVVITPCPPSGSAHAHTHSLTRAFTACLLNVVDIKVRKLSTPSQKDVDFILAGYMAYQSSNKTQFCSMVIHVHHRSVHSEDSDDLAHMRSLARAFTVYYLYTI